MKFFSKILNYDIGSVREIRHQINMLLRYRGGSYTLLHSNLANYIRNHLSQRDLQQNHALLAGYYDCQMDAKRDCKNMTNSGFCYLAHHYREAKNFEELSGIALDDQFQRRKNEAF